MPDDLSMRCAYRIVDHLLLNGWSEQFADRSEQAWFRLGLALVLNG